MPGLELCLLGPVTATRDGRPLDLGGPRPRAVLAVLATAAPATVSDGGLLTGAWPPGADARPGTLQHHVSRLRRGLGGGVTRRGGGYALDLDPGAVDAVRFARLAAGGAAALATGSPAVAATALGGALGLWRGEALAGLADLPGLAPAAARLTELRTAAEEDLAEALLRTGRVAEAAGRARELTARSPLRERGWVLLARALAEGGRRADALAALRRVRRVLAAELGLDPGAALLAAEAALLADPPRPAVRPARLHLRHRARRVPAGSGPRGRR
ncbi:AfsR/SARP family transcriptional regulator [Geodermatophilus sp. FMUSA9-8]|uniref:AfsR/SARP family transcriptional regulator n=1 Tax=Geodermatophilus sp. FMUSA9-8 TaxID=3120155 RepID=UPI00300ADE74